MDLSAPLTEALSVFLHQEWGLTGVDIRWEFPSSEHGDIATPLAFHLAKHLRTSPLAIAERLMIELQKCSGVECCAIAGTGYVNVWFTPEALLKGLSTTQKACVPIPLLQGSAPIIVEYSQPNIAKPLGIHHILSTVIGQSIANLLEHLGVNVIRVNHIGDWGTQFGKLAIAVERWGTKPVHECSLDELLALYVKFHEEAEKDPTLEVASREAFRKLECGDEKLRLFWKEVVHITMDAMNALYERLHVHIEHAHGEAMYEDMMASILADGIKKGVFKSGENGAVIVEFPPETQLPTAVVQKADSASIYMTRDFAQIRYRIDRWHPQAMYYVVDVAQTLHFQQLFAAVRMLGWDLPRLEHVVFGRMRFAEKSMSTRKGNILKLQDVLDEAVKRALSVIAERGDKIQTDDPGGLAEMMGVGAVVYGVLSQNRRMDMVFDWEKFLSFDGNSAPYLQYTYARARSVLRKAGGEGGSSLVSSFTPLERALVVRLLQFPSVLSEAREDHMPHKLCRYLYQLCQGYNAFYNVDPILTASSSVRDARLFFTSCTAMVLRTGATLLTLQVPDHM